MRAIKAQDITGVILAGGRGHRMGGVDKGLVPLHGRPLVEYVMDALRPQVGRLIISANRNRDIYASYGFPVIADDAAGDYEGPLAGMLSALRAVDTPYILFAPCDTPRLPPDLVRRLAAESSNASVVACEGRMQPVVALLHARLASSLQEYFEEGGRGTGEWLRRLGAALVDFSDEAETFENINTPEQLQHFQMKAPLKT
ncbi:MAG: hypothetical protein A3E57_05085 [Candidatus Muproteobacteria bacterium RIFCSPHIGHO2_12_FULL_60_33]|uniref:Molybdenum cofactor guanylyltransferase n=1 Tax=Candidatus Muproteobacteria bacterium RIFCSPLOWO2_01_FULL_60_18 TaxID=1817768 RepID=A0A1F6TXD8_9PROT|nr:MAG: hypothetical protein A3A87_10065 [Candidatus Muproteobacteria bacterium RIFCSPLOWO2_01_FULL_60_18]OGI53218.1 MAG: hypothetical protein A2W42_07640 [Candidatus Muproteobacteria bacterium RIFCSPHIGHO2_01_60_12]OGI54905.1 MAG: hypothetical protein A3D32_08815 [Candidatus Muproteobacteria bacterium RIFCSPHIGHO2_02_FULL_60_13]OGI55951.1 MAG: hypothetical protein A3E57_05085 [Candidatus Muproteobacteria bacterium RIFCSPHIGHO2_12_FULL_60_33]OGI59351.1 MAG: hypothetical protein A2809_04350 [Can